MLHLHRLKLELDLFFVTEQYCSNLLFCVRGDGIVWDAVKYIDNSRLESNIWNCDPVAVGHIKETNSPLWTVNCRDILGLILQCGGKLSCVKPELHLWYCLLATLLLVSFIQLAYQRQLLICNLCFAPFIPEGMHFSQYRKLASDTRYGGTAHNAWNRARSYIALTVTLWR